MKTLRTVVFVVGVLVIAMAPSITALLVATGYL